MVKYIPLFKGVPKTKPEETLEGVNLTVYPELSPIMDTK